MEYNYLNQPHPNQHPGPEYVHAQHGLYQLVQASQGAQGDYPVTSGQGQVNFPPTSVQSRGDYRPTTGHPQYVHPLATGQGHEPMQLNAPQQVEIARGHNVITVAGHHLPTTLHQPLVGYHVADAHSIRPRTSSMAQPGPMVTTTNLPSLPVTNFVTIASPQVAPVVQQAPPPVTLASIPGGPGISRETVEGPSGTDSAEKSKDAGAADPPLGGPLPEGLAYRRLDEKSVCVVAEEVIGRGVRFGPFKGAFGKGPMHYNNMLSWELTLEGRVVGFLSPIKGEKAWTTFVRCAQREGEQNAEVGQYCGRIYFTMLRDIQPGEELKVFYSDDYRESCGFKQKLGDLKYNEDTKSFMCHLCPCHCSTSKSMFRHMKLFHQKEKTSSFDISFAQTTEETQPGPKPVGQSVRKPSGKRDVDDDDSEEDKGQFYMCSICGKLFSTVGRLISHKKVHGVLGGEGSAEYGEHACQLCGYICMDSSTLTKHMDAHKTSQHGCEQCGQVFKNREKMLEHKKDKHRLAKLVKIKLRVKKQPNACATCGFMCSTEEALDEHVRRHKMLPYGCPQCGSMYKKRNTLLRHLRVKHNAMQRKRQSPVKPAESSEFRCETCFFNCSNAEQLAEHAEKHKEGPHGCDECGLVYSQKRFVARHKRDSHGAPIPDNRRGFLSGNRVCPWACDECSKTYSNLPSLRRHQKVKHGRVSEARYTLTQGYGSADKSPNLNCYLCEANFDTDEDFKKHLREVHGMETITSSEKKGGSLVIQSNVLTGSRCYICSQMFKKPSLLNEHLRQLHGIDAPFRTRGSQAADASEQASYAPETATPSGPIDMLGKPMDYYNRPRPFKCNDCARRFINKGNLRQHMLKFHLDGSKFSCSFCKKGFAQESQLLVHIQAHTKVRPFKCVVCPRSFASQSAFVNHQSQHTGEKPHKCSVCGLGFKTVKQAGKHKRRVHSTKERPHKCSFCEKRFLSKREHEVHERRHKGIRPFVCLTCGKAFKDTRTRKVHYRVHTGERPYSCPVCGRAFRQSHNLTDHMVMHTKENMEQSVAVSSVIQM